MDILLVSAKLRMNVSLLNLMKYIKNDQDLVNLARHLKGDDARTKEFFKTFLHRKKYSVSARWQAVLEIGNYKHEILKTITVNSEGLPEYEDEALVNFAIQRYVAACGYRTTLDCVKKGIDSHGMTKFNSFAVAIRVMHMTNFGSVVRSEFGIDLFTPEEMIQIIEVLEEVEV